MDATPSRALHLGEDTSFARAFERAWARPTPEGLVELLHPEVILRQPNAPTIRGRDAALAEFRRLLRWLPGTRGVIERTISAQDSVFIEWTLVLPIGRRGLRIHAVDTFQLKDGLGYRREVYFDQVPVFAAVLLHPWVIPGFLRYRFGGA